MVDINKHILLIEKKKGALDGVIGQYIKALTLQPGFTPAEFNIDNYYRVADMLKTYKRMLPLFKNKQIGN